MPRSSRSSTRSPIRKSIPAESEPGAPQDPVQVPITGDLDLHTFSPRDLGTLLPEYFRLCREKGLLRIRVIHGKGSGRLKAGVLALLPRLPEVAGFTAAPESEGGWGATLVFLHPLRAAAQS